MKYLSLCSGIEAATVAWHHMGWQPIAFSEIEPFPSAVLAHHYPNTPNWGDMTRFKEWPDANINVLVGGTPCQSFSVAGLRKGLDDPRGNLMLTYLAIAAKYRPQWLVWENVPGVLSSNGGRDFASLLRGMGELGYGFAYRVLDAQYFGVAQRRRRVFVVGCLGSWQRAAAVLFEQHSLQGHPAPSREAGQGTARGAAGGAGVGGYRMTAFGEYAEDGTASAMKARDFKDATDLVAQPVALDYEFNAHSVDTATGPLLKGSPSGGGHPLPAVMQPVAVAFGGDIVRSLTARHDSSPCADRGMDVVAVAQPVASENGDIASTLRTGGNDHADVYNSVATAMQVRRLTPVECERLQGFPDNYTGIPWRGKPADQCPDGPRYKALGNSMAVPVMRWIGERIQAVEAI